MNTQNELFRPKFYFFIVFFLRLCYFKGTFLKILEVRWGSRSEIASIRKQLEGRFEILYAPVCITYVGVPCIES